MNTLPQPDDRPPYSPEVCVVTTGDEDPYLMMREGLRPEGYFQFYGQRFLDHWPLQNMLWQLYGEHVPSLAKALRFACEHAYTVNWPLFQDQFYRFYPDMLSVLSERWLEQEELQDMFRTKQVPRIGHTEFVYMAKPGELRVQLWVRGHLICRQLNFNPELEQCVLLTGPDARPRGPVPVGTPHNGMQFSTPCLIPSQLDPALLDDHDGQDPVRLFLELHMKGGWKKWRVARALQRVYDMIAAGEGHFAGELMAAVQSTYPREGARIEKVRTKMVQELEPGQIDYWAEMARQPHVQRLWARTFKDIPEEENPAFQVLQPKLEKRFEQREVALRAEMDQAARDRHLELVNDILAGKNVRLTNDETQRLYEMPWGELQTVVKVAASASSREEFVEGAGLVNGGPRANGSGED